jgi:hypothetical protein
MDDRCFRAGPSGRGLPFPEMDRPHFERIVGKAPGLPRVKHGAAHTRLTHAGLIPAGQEKAAEPGGHLKRSQGAHIEQSNAVPSGTGPDAHTGFGRALRGGAIRLQHLEVRDAHGLSVG